MLKFYLLFGLVVLSTLSLAQEITFQKYGVKEGLSSNTVFSTIEDKDGFIWISTEEGVDRFDGLNFKHYSLPKLYEYRTVNRVEYRLKIDSNNQIWLFTIGGLLYNYDPWKDEFVLFHMIQEEYQGAARTFYIDHADNLWFGMRDGVLVMNPVTKELRRITSIKHPVSAIIQDSNQRFYLGSTNGIAVLDDTQHFLYNLQDVGSEQNTGLLDSPISSLFFDEQNDVLWVGSNKVGLCAFNLVNFDFVIPENYSQPNGLVIRNFERFSENEIIMAIDGEGLIIWNLNDYKVVQRVIPEDIPNSLGSRSVQQVFRNSSGVFFIATYHGGLNVHSPGKLNFNSIQHISNNENSLPNDVVMTLNEISPGIIGFKTDAGLSLWNKEENIWQHLHIDHNDVKNISNSRAITVDRSKNIWATSYTDSLVVFKHTRNGKYFSTKDYHPDLRSLNFTEVYAGKNDIIWFSDDDRKRITSYSLINQQIKHFPFPFGNVQTMLSVDTGRMAIGTSSGLVIVNTKNGIANDLPMINESRLKSAMISSLSLDANKQLWVGTRYEGLFIINFFRNTVTQLTLENGLLSNRIFSLTFDGDNVWASTSKGISRIDNQYNINTFTESDGLISVGFNYNAALRDSDGQLYFGTNDGVINFMPSDIGSVKHHKSLAFDEFYLNHELVLAGETSPLNKPLSQTDAIELEHDQNSFSISFTSIDFLNSDQGNYEWKLENFDQQWITNQGPSTASYTNLNPGSYLFRVRMTGQKGELISDEKQLVILIHQPFWMTYWAFCIYLIIVLSLVALIAYSNGLRVESNQSKERLHFLINMAHEIKTPLMLIKAPLTDLLNNTEVNTPMQQGINIALRNADKVHKQMLQFLDFRRLHQQKSNIDLESVDLVELLKDKVFAFKVLADKKNIDFQLEVKHTDFIIKSDQKILDKVVSNLLSNAIKYTDTNGKVRVKLVATNNKCQILIEDTGIGIPLSQKKKIFRLFYRTPTAKESGNTGSGVGLVLARDLAMLINGKVALEKSSPRGSVFSFTIPHTGAIPKDEVLNGQMSDLSLNEQVGNADSRVRVLLVEDDLDLNEFSKSKLSKHYNITTAANGQLALESLKKSLPDLVISDVMMPKMNGRQLCMNLKKNIETCHIPVILLTGLESKEHIMQGLESGADDYIIKPYDYELLMSKIEGLLQNRLVLKSKFLIYDEKEEKIEFSNKLDNSFIDEITQFVKEHISDTSLSSKDLYEAMGMSRSSFYHKLKSLIDISPNEFIRTIRLKTGRELLLKQNYNVSEVAYNVGFSDAKYFGTLFKKYFGQSPSTFVVERKTTQKKVSI